MLERMMSEEQQSVLEELLPKGNEGQIQGQFVSIDEYSEAIHARCCSGQCITGTCRAS